MNEFLKVQLAVAMRRASADAQAQRLEPGKTQRRPARQGRAGRPAKPAAVVAVKREPEAVAA
jgi:hypothetical protein